MVQSLPPDVNVLPAGYRPMTITPRRAATILLVAALIFGLLPAFAALSGVRQAKGDLETLLSVLDGQLAQLQGNEASLAQMEMQISQTQSEIDGLREEFGAFGQERVPRSDGVAAAVAYLVPRVHIKSLLQVDDTVLLTGEAGSQALVLDYSSALLNSGQFANVRIISMVNADPLGLAPDVTFSIALEG